MDQEVWEENEFFTDPNFKSDAETQGKVEK